MKTVTKIGKCAVIPTERYSLKRQAEFLLSNAIDEKDYKTAVKSVKKLGLDPKIISQHKSSQLKKEK